MSEHSVNRLLLNAAKFPSLTRRRIPEDKTLPNGRRNYHAPAALNLLLNASPVCYHRSQILYLKYCTIYISVL